MPDTYSVEPRTVIGKNVKKLRREGIIPANIYGRGLESKAVQLPFADARALLNHHGRNVLINVSVDGEDRARPVVVRDIEREPVSGALQHIDFYQVDLTRAIHGNVTVVFVGEAPAVEDHGGILVTDTDTVSIEALPGDMPESIELSVEGLTEIDQALRVSDLVPPAGVTILTDPEISLVHISRPRLIEAEELPEGEAGAEAPPAGAGADED
ncbi:MAG: 50S ribosomal protein L25 [Dehalococcoidia bacterium]